MRAAALAGSGAFFLQEAIMQMKRTNLVARVERTGVDGRGPRIRAIITGPLPAPVDVTHCLTAAVAHCLWQARGGDDAANWADAEATVEQLLAGIATESRNEGRTADGRTTETRAGEVRREVEPAPEVAVPARRPAGKR